jgi:hypothetical protein
LAYAAAASFILSAEMRNLINQQEKKNDEFKYARDE